MIDFGIMKKTILRAYEITKVSNDGEATKLELISKDLVYNHLIKATIGRLLPILVNDATQTGIPVIGKIPAEEVDNYNSSIYSVGLPSKEINGQDSVLSESPNEPFTRLITIEDDYDTTIDPLQVGDLLIVEETVE